MKIVRYITDAEPQVGVVVGDRVVDVTTLGHAADSVAILAAGPRVWAELSEAAKQSGRAESLASVQLLAPVERPSKFLAAGLNSRDHIEEVEVGTTERAKQAKRRNALVKEAFPTPMFATFFNKQVGCITGPTAPIWMPRASHMLDFEGEVAVVVGRVLRNADEAAAREAIAGYTVTNDVSVRDWQTTTSQMWLGKSYDTHGPVGPWIVTSDEFESETATIRTWVNGEQRQEGHLRDQILSPAKLLSQLSQVCSLQPGDLVATGTPAGVGAVQERWLQIGDRVRVEVSGIGEIENVVVAEPV